MAYSVKKGQARYCCRTCYETAKGTPAERVATEWRDDPLTGCRVWTGPTMTGGYGYVSMGRGHYERAHRVAWESHVGPIPERMIVCHACDNPPCIRIDHLFLGTDASNALDKVAKGRARGGRLRGERSPNAKLTSRQVIEIREKRAAGMLHRQLAAEYGVWQGTISTICRRRTWKDIP
jgi:hypothetical protein